MSPAIGASMAANGMVVGSVPVTNVGANTLTSATTNQIAAVTSASTGQAPASVRGATEPAKSTRAVATVAQTQSAIATTASCS